MNGSIFNPTVEQVKAYRAEHDVDLSTAWNTLKRQNRKAHRHTYINNSFRLVNCRRGHSAVYQRQCNVCGVWFCKECEAKK